MKIPIKKFVSEHLTFTIDNEAKDKFWLVFEARLQLSMMIKIVMSACMMIMKLEP